MPKRKKLPGESTLDQSFRLKKIAPMTDTQSDVFDAYFENYNLFLYGCAGTGKAQPLDAVIYTPNGWTTMGDLKVGQTIYAKDGSPTTVTGIFPQGITEVWSVKFDDGRVVECCPEHLWKVYADTDKYKNGVVINTVELARLKTLTSLRDRIRIDLFEPIEDNTTHSLPMCPYLLGLLLGDGGFNLHSVSFTNADDTILTEVEKRLEPGYYLHQVSRYDYRITQGVDGKGSSNHYLEILDGLNLRGVKSENKWIPPSYLNASVSQRWELLRGLMDTDGTADISGSLSFSSSSERLALDVQYLVWSLGGIASMSIKTPHYHHNGELRFGLPSYRVNIRLKNPTKAFGIERKRNRVSDNNQYASKLKLGVLSVEQIGNKETQCIMIDHPDHLYVTDGFVVTHNTYISLYLALKEVLNPNSPFRKVYMVRSSVPSRDMGFMPGKLNEKMSVYEAPYIGMVNDLFGRGDAYQIAAQKGVFEMVSTSFLRGLTFEHCIVIADEIQNCSFQELDTLITRIGNDTKIIMCGDIEQCDLYRNKYDLTGLPSFMKILEGMECFDFIEFQPEDIVRSGLVKEYILQKRKLEHKPELLGPAAMA